MEYPIWHLTTLGGGFWIALIATVHVYVAHFAIGGGLFLVLTEQAAYKYDNPHLLDYAKKYSRFFLLLTMAFGAVSGVAIWFTVALLAPEATLTLIHNFVFGWAAEWVCFLGEIVALIIYYYTWDTMNRRDHVVIGWLYFIFGWFSLFLINGIIGFQLTPGDWLQTRDFFDGFFNPSFWPSLVFRTFLCAFCAAMFGFVTATRIKDEATRLTVIRVCSALTIASIAAVIASGYWYIAALPAEQHALIMGKSQRVSEFLRYFWIFGTLAVLGALAMAVRLPRTISFPLALVVLLIGQGLFGSFEFMREAGRKPYIIWDRIYSNGIAKSHVPVLNSEGVLLHAKWTPPELRGGITDENRVQAGAFLYQLQCASCHSLGGIMNPIEKRTNMYDANGMDAFLTGMGKINKYMPPFVGTEEERMTLATYIAEEINGSKPVQSAEAAELPEVEPAPFDAESDEFALVAWADQGMRFYAETDKWILVPPGNEIRAQLIRRDGAPDIVTEDVEIRYSVESGFKGEPLTGTLELHEDARRFQGRVRILPYQDGEFNSLPVVTLEARVAGSDTVLATAKVAAPVSDQMGCRNCHGGDWANKTSGIGSATAANILETHDRINGTNHVERAEKGRILCVECHDDPKQGAEGSPDRPNLSTAIHSLHAVYLAGREADRSCLMCHPKNTLRGQHKEVGFDCTNCHGTMADHALSLVKGEQAKGKKSVEKYLMLLVPQAVGNVSAITPRQPWINEPDCLTCHVDFEAPDTDSAFNVWVKEKGQLYSDRRDEMDAMNCAACHGSPHAVYPAGDRDNVQPMQYMGEARALGAEGSCTVCHVDEMEDAAHHSGMGLE